MTHRINGRIAPFALLGLAATLTVATLAATALWPESIPPAFAQATKDASPSAPPLDIGTIDEKATARAYKAPSYSPYAGRSNFPTQVFWGDTHVHTSASMDAGAFGNRLGFEDSYRFARGEELTASGGLRVKLSRPLDFQVIADHSDNMGFFPKLLAGDPVMLGHPDRQALERHGQGGRPGSG